MQKCEERIEEWRAKKAGRMTIVMRRASINKIAHVIMMMMMVLDVREKWCFPR